MAVNVKSFRGLNKAATPAMVKDQPPSLGAALACHTIFAVPPQSVIVIFVAGLVFDPDAVRWWVSEWKEEIESLWRLVQSRPADGWMKR